MADQSSETVAPPNTCATTTSNNQTMEGAKLRRVDALNMEAGSTTHTHHSQVNLNLHMICRVPGRSKFFYGCIIHTKTYTLCAGKLGQDADLGISVLGSYIWRRRDISTLRVFQYLYGWY